jgi:hypothetical protein
MYDGDDDLEVFMTWIHAFMSFLDLHQIVGDKNDHNRTTILHSSLKGLAKTWYDNSVRMGMQSVHAFLPDFVLILI